LLAVSNIFRNKTAHKKTVPGILLKRLKFFYGVLNGADRY